MKALVYIILLLNICCISNSPVSQNQAPPRAKDWTTTLLIDDKSYPSDEPIHIYNSSSKSLLFSFNEKIDSFTVDRKEGEGDFKRIKNEHGFFSINYFTQTIHTDDQSTFTFKITSTYKRIKKEHIFQVILSRGKRLIQSPTEIADVTVFQEGTLQNGSILVFNQDSVQLQFTFDDVPCKYIEYKTEGEENYKRLIVHEKHHELSLPTHSITTGKKTFHIRAISGTQKIRKINEFQVTLDPPVARVDPVIITKPRFFTCASTSEPCPSNIGLLLHGVGETTERCTTFHYNKGVFATNSHCLPVVLHNKENVSCEGLLTSYFITSTGIQKFECDRVIAQKKEGALDYAFYTVKERVSLPSMEWDNLDIMPDHLESWSVYNAKDGRDNLVLKKATCKLFWDAYPKFHSQAAAHMHPFLSYGGDKSVCTLESGTSGSPLLSPTHQLLGIHSLGFTYKPEFLSYFKNGVVKTGANAACIESINTRLNKEACQAHGVTHAENARLSKLLSNLIPADLKLIFDSALADFKNNPPRFAPSSFQYMDKYTTHRFLLNNFSGNENLLAYLFPLPNCNVWKQTTYIRLPICQVKISINAQLKLEKIESTNQICEINGIMIKPLPTPGHYTSTAVTGVNGVFYSGPIHLPACVP
jgi:V8-like Glu-specific endopeptidase